MSVTIFDKIRAVATFKNVRILYKLPYFSTPVRACPVCGSAEHRYEAENRFFKIHRCASCGHCYAARTPGRRILDSLYGNLVHWQGDKVHQGITDMKYGPEWDGFIEARTSILKRSGLLADDSPPLNVFEIGCAEGMILHVLSKAGHETSGSEMNPLVAQGGIDALGVKIYPDLFENIDLPKDHFDIIMSFHTLEHMCSPCDVFERINSLLKPEGGVVIEVPTGPEEYSNTDHVQFFEENSLRLLIDTYFHESEIIMNEYPNAKGVRIGSLYGIGRRPKSLK